MQNLGDEAGILCERALRPAYVNGQVLPFGPAALLERFAKGAKHRRERRHRPDHGYAPNPTSLLRARRERPRRRAAKKRDEFAAFHGPMPPVLRPKDSTLRYRRRLAALRDFGLSYVGCGSFTSDRYVPDRRMSASPPRASKRWHRSEMTRCATSRQSRRSPAGRRFTLRQFAFTPVALTKAAFVLSSFLICASSSAGVKTSGSTPIVASFSCTFGASMAFNVSR